VALIAVAIWGVMRYRQAIAEFWPQTASFYGALGMPVNARGLMFDSISYSRETAAGQPVLVVKGTIENIGARSRQAPPIIVVLTDKNRHPVDRWVFSAGARPLSPGEKANFTTHRTNPPESARHLEMTFAEDGG
jgi:hypothetical protein